MRITITPVNIALSATTNKIVIYTSGCIVGSSGGGTWGTITGTLSDQTDLQNALDLKVDKVTDKQLSTEDYTTLEKQKLAGIEAGAEVNVNADWNASSGDAQILNKPTLAAVATSGSYNDLSGTPTFKTINSESIIGTGNIEISGGLDKTFQTLVYAAQIITDGSISVNSVVTLTGATAELQLPTNPVLGELFTWDVIQDAVGGRLLTYAAGFQFSGGIVPILSAAVNAKDSLTFICKAANVFEFKYATFNTKQP